MSHLSQVEADKRTSKMGPEVKASRIWLKWHPLRFTNKIIKQTNHTLFFFFFVFFFNHVIVIGFYYN